MHTAAIVQARNGGPIRQHYDRKIAERTTPKETPAQPQAPARQHRLPNPSTTNADAPFRRVLTQERYEVTFRSTGWCRPVPERILSNESLKGGIRLDEAPIDVELLPELQP